MAEQPTKIIGRFVQKEKKMAERSLVAVQFHSHVIEALQEPSGELLVNLRKCCESIGLDFSSQLKRLNDPERSPWATVVIRTAVAQDQKLREVVMIDLDTLGMWLATMQVGRVKEECKPLLRLFQKEAARTLRRHFFGGSVELPNPAKQTHPPLAGDRLIAQAAALMEQATQLKALEEDYYGLTQELVEVKVEIEETRASIAEVMVETNDTKRLVAEILEESKQSRVILGSMYLSDEPAPELSLRKKIRGIHGEIFRATGRRDAEGIWNRLYDRYNLAAETNVSLIQRNNPGKYPAKLDVVEAQGKMELLHAIATQYAREVIPGLKTEDSIATP